MTALVQDPILRTARSRMLAAATHYGRAIRELTATMRMLEKHPDFRKTKRRQKAGAPLHKALTLAWWTHNCCLSVMHDGNEEAHELLRGDARGGAERSMVDFIETEERDLARTSTRAA